MTQVVILLRANDLHFRKPVLFLRDWCLAANSVASHHISKSCGDCSIIFSSKFPLKSMGSFPEKHWVKEKQVLQHLTLMKPFLSTLALTSSSTKANRISYISKGFRITPEVTDSGKKSVIDWQKRSHYPTGCPLARRVSKLLPAAKSQQKLLTPKNVKVPAAYFSV